MTPGPKELLDVADDFFDLKALLVGGAVVLGLMYTAFRNKGQEDPDQVDANDMILGAVGKKGFRNPRN